MPFTSGHLYLTVHGVAINLGVVEEWQFGLRIDGVTVAMTQAQLNERAEQYLADIRTWWLAVKPRFSNNTGLTHIKLARVGPDGLYPAGIDAVVRNLAVADQAGATANPPLPAQLAVVMTLETEATRGLASKGRIFLPAPDAASLSPQGGLTGGVRDALLAATAALLTGLNNEPGIDNPGYGRVHVMSRTRAGASRRVINVALGSRFDTQRRRAEKFPEAPTRAAVG